MRVEAFTEARGDLYLALSLSRALSRSVSLARSLSLQVMPAVVRGNVSLETGAGGRALCRED